MARLIAMAIPIIKGKEDEWRKFADELNGRFNEDFMESRRQLNVHERVYYQKTPMGDLVIVTLEGDNPEQSFAKFGKGNDDFTRWFVQKVKEIHGFDLTEQLRDSQLPEFVIDSMKQHVKV